jgi:hypothetical protein
MLKLVRQLRNRLTLWRVGLHRGRGRFGDALVEFCGVWVDLENQLIEERGFDTYTYLRRRGGQELADRLSALHSDEYDRSILKLHTYATDIPLGRLTFEIVAELQRIARAVRSPAIREIKSDLVVDIASNTADLLAALRTYLNRLYSMMPRDLSTEHTQQFIAGEQAKLQKIEDASRNLRESLATLALSGPSAAEIERIRRECALLRSVAAEILEL